MNRILTLFVTLAFSLVLVTVALGQTDASCSAVPIGPEIRLTCEFEKLLTSIQNLENYPEPREVAYPPAGQRYIMAVEGQKKIIASDSFRSKSGSGKSESVKSHSVVFELTGSSGQNLKRVYLIFQDSTNQREPIVLGDAAFRSLYIWYPFSYLQTAEKTLEKTQGIYVWVGNFATAGGKTNLHADIHVAN